VVGLLDGTLDEGDSVGEVDSGEWEGKALGEADGSTLGTGVGKTVGDFEGVELGCLVTNMFGKRSCPAQSTVTLSNVLSS